DAAATGRVTVERDGFSVEHAARFLLIGTMNPEEGELRPQLLDRLGMTVEVTAPTDPAARAEVVRRRMAYDADAAGFAAHYHDAEEALADRIAKARGALERVHLSEAALLKIAEVCAAFEVDGLRADIVTSRVAVAHAAWKGRETVTRADIRRAALLTLPHRRRRNPFDSPGLDEELLDRILGDEDPPPDPPQPPDPPESPDASDSSEDTGPADADPQDPQAHEETDRNDTGPDSPGPESAEAPDGTDDAPDGEALPPTDPPQEAAEDPEDGDASPPSSEGATSTVGSTTPYRPRTFTVRGAGQGADGRR